MSALTIRRATDADWSAIWPLWRAVVAAGDTYSYDPQTSEADARASWLAPAPAETWVGCDDAGVLIGRYHLAPNHGGPGAHVVNGSYMVEESTRGGGVGRALVLHSLERAAATGYRGIQFNAVAATNVHAIRLYEQLGFRTLGAVPGGFCHPRAGYVDLLIMYRDLADGDG